MIRAPGIRRAILASSAIALVVVGACSSDETQTTGAAGSGPTGPSSGGGPSSSGAAGHGGDASGTGASTASSGGAGGVGTASGGGGTGGVVDPGMLDCSQAVGSVPPLKLTEVASGLANPVLVKSAPGDPTRLYIVEQSGKIEILSGGAVLPTPFLDLVAITQFTSEQGLLGLAFHPDYAQNGRFFVHYTAKGGAMTVAEYARSANPDVAVASAIGMVISQPDPDYLENGGSIEFSPVDGLLYVFWGDGGKDNDPDGNGQNLGVKLGKVLRLDVTSLPYAIPPGNMTGAGVSPEIWDYGLRNPWRASFDGCTGDLYIGDVGQGLWEEIEVEAPGQGNKNYGWNLLEGPDCFGGNPCTPGNGNVLPTASYDHNIGNAVIGGVVYRGSNIPGLRGTYLYGDNVTGRVWSFVLANGKATAEADLTQDLASDALEISSFGQDAAGEVYVVDLAGAVYRIDPE